MRRERIAIRPDPAPIDPSERGKSDSPCGDIAMVLNIQRVDELDRRKWRDRERERERERERGRRKRRLVFSFPSVTRGFGNIRAPLSANCPSCFKVRIHDFLRRAILEFDGYDASCKRRGVSLSLSLSLSPPFIKNSKVSILKTKARSRALTRSTNRTRYLSSLDFDLDVIFISTDFCPRRLLTASGTDTEEIKISRERRD